METTETEFSGREMTRDRSVKDQNLMTWIVVLAIAITCCAILFLVFANYLSVINKNLAIANARLTTMESNEAQLLSEIQALHRTMIANNKTAPGTPPNAGTPPESATPPSPGAPPSPSAPPAPPPVTH